MWDTAVNNKLHSIKPVLSEWRPAYRMDRKEEVVLTRLRIGHSYATHSYLLKVEEQPMCIPCDAPFSIKHVLLYCVDFENARNRYYRVSTLKELFESVEINIFLYLKAIGLYTKLQIQNASLIFTYHNLQFSLIERTFLILVFYEFPVDQEIHCFICFLFS